MPQLMGTLELKDCIITADVLNCQKVIAEKAIEKKADYVLAIKGNHPVAYDEIRRFMDRQADNAKPIMHLPIDSHGMPVRAIATEGINADCSQASALIEGNKTEYLLADKTYDTDVILDKAESPGMTPVIPPKKRLKIQRSYDKYLYKLRHLAENAFLSIKSLRGIATRYAKNESSYVAAAQIRRILLWAKIS